MVNVDDILGQLPIDEIAGRLGVDHATASSAVEAALPALLGGMQANAGDARGAASLTEALGQHQDDLLDDVLAGRRGLDDVDTTDGDRIVGHVFGDRREQVASRLSGATDAGSGLIAKVLPILAPLVMSYLAKRVLGGAGGSGTSAGGPGPQAGGIDLGDILGQVLGGGGSSGRASSAPGGVDIGDLLGGLLGGGRR